RPGGQTQMEPARHALRPVGLPEFVDRREIFVLVKTQAREMEVLLTQMNTDKDYLESSVFICVKPNPIR
ncbi:MAG: hypothetical protein MI920_29055, partial [Kiloniellales bacterium]|nr:hypothetical protein [Kiloniellales bacterium]